MITIAHTREDGTDGERCENGTHKMERRFVCRRSMLQMIDDVLDIDMMCGRHSRVAGRENPTAE
jgi:hypothetical protein